MIKKIIYSILPIVIGMQMNTYSMQNSTVNTNARIKFGLSAGVNFQQNKTKFKINDSLQAKQSDTLKKLLALSSAEVNNELQPYKTQVDISKTKNNNKTIKINAYTANEITGNTDNTKLPSNSTTITLNSSEYDSGDNKTKYILVNSGNTKYNASTGLIDNNGSSITDIPVEVHPNILNQNNITKTDATSSTSDTTNINNYYKLTSNNNFQNTNVNELYITPKQYEMLKTIDNSNSVTPNYVSRDDLGPVTQSVFKDIFTDRAYAYKWLVNFKNNNDNNKILHYDKKLYINSNNYPSLGLDDNLLKEICNLKNEDLLNNTWKSFNDINKWSVDLNIGLFSDIILNKKNLLRIELSCDIPVYNNKFEIYNSNKLYDFNYYGISINKQLSMQLKLMYGHYFTEKFKFLIGLGIEYNKYKLGLHNLYTQYSIDNYAQTKWARNIGKSIIDDYNNTLKNKYGISSDSINKEINKFSPILILGFEYNLNKNNIIGIELSSNPEVKLMNNTKDLGNLQIEYVSIRFNYKYVF